MLTKTLEKLVNRLQMKKKFLQLLFIFCAFVVYGQQDAKFKTDELVIKLSRNTADLVDLNSGRAAPDLINLSSFDAVSRDVKAISVDYTFHHNFKHAAKARELGLDQYLTIKVPTGVDVRTLAAKYRALREVELVEFNYIAEAHVVPNDPLYGEQWGLNNTGNAKQYSTGNLVGTPGADLNLEAAWDIHTGNSSITIAIIDSGVDGSHPDFQGKMVAGYDYHNNDNDPSDDNGHGTSCAGIAAASGNNGIGVAGVNWGARIMPLKALGADGSGSYQAIADAIIFAVDNNADVISMSLGGSASASVLANAVNYAYNAGVPIFASRGNGNNTNDNYPSSYTTVISVGGLSPCDTRKTPSSCDGENWWGASYGGGANKMDFVAPAARITTADITGSGGYSNGDYTDSFNGTSSACPFAAGIGALVLSYSPGLTPDELRDILRQTSVDIGASGYDAETGYGRLDAAAALNASVTCALGAPGNLAASNITDNSFNLSWNAVSGAASYTVTIDGTPSTVSGTSFSANGLTAGTTYACSVAANCSEGGSGSPSSINVTTTGTAPITCNGTVSSYPYGEGFESGDGWTQASGDDGNWHRDSGTTPSNNTGPSSAAEGSWFLFLEASTNGSPGQIGNNATAILESPCFDLSGESSATFSFQNHMYGSAVGSITVEATNNDQTWTQLWSNSGNQGNQWNSVSLNLDAYTGGTVKLRIIGTTGNGWSSDIAIDDLAVTTSGGGDTEAPSTPTNLSASNTTQTSTDLSWNASTDNVGVTGYTVYQDGASIGTTASTSYAVSGLTASTTYTFTVTASDAAGNESAASNGLNVTTESPAPDTQAPSVPTNLSASNTTQTTTDLSWNASTDNVGVTGYTVYQDGVSIGTTGSTSYSVSGLTASTTYTFTVTASDAAGNESAASSGLNVTTSDPSSGPSVLLASYFETGWDGWVDGGADAWRYTGGTYSFEGVASIRLRDNTNSSVMTTAQSYDLSSFNNVEVDFYFYPRSMENNEDFWLQFYDGNSWITVAAWASGVNFSNNNFYHTTVVINSADYNFTSNNQFRFRCDASANGDQVFIDQVTITADGGSSTGAIAQIIENLGRPKFRTESPDSDIDFEWGFLVYPNPAKNVLNIKLGDPSIPMTYRIINLAGQTIQNGDLTSTEINISDLINGMYIIELNNGEERKLQRFIKE